jgi:TetR/AcrR family transcriptional regulator
VGDPTEDILAAAGRLFGQLGVGETTMSRLAAEVGLGQSSLYYYFRSRDEVVAALVARANVVPLSLIAELTADHGSVPSKLFRFVRGDVAALCALPFDINEIHRVAARDRERFDTYWRERTQLIRRLASLLRTGEQAGDLRALDAQVMAVTIISNDEGSQNWYRIQTSRRPAEVADALAELTVAGLLSPRCSLESVLSEVGGLDARARA